MKHLLVLLVLFSPLAWASDLPRQHAVWDREPITVLLSVNHERLVSFPSSVQFNSPQPNTSLSDSALKVTNNSGTLYLTAVKAFAKTRVNVTLADGQVLLLDLVGLEGEMQAPLSIELKSEVTQTETGTSLPYVDLTRFALQSLFAPKRLVPERYDLVRVPLKSTRFTASLFRNQNVTAMPLISWQGEGFYTTAVAVRNASYHALTLDPKLLCGNWVTATFFPRTQLSRSHSRDDHATLILLSRQPFAKALEVCHGR